MKLWRMEVLGGSSPADRIAVPLARENQGAHQGWWPSFARKPTSRCGYISRVWSSPAGRRHTETAHHRQYQDDWRHLPRSPTASGRERATDSGYAGNGEIYLRLVDRI